jgi:hypothetical protein
MVSWKIERKNDVVRRILNLAWCFSVGILVLVVIYVILLQPFLRCWELRNSVLAALDRASIVRVVEHSDISDVRTFDPDGDSRYQEVTYATVTLNRAEIVSLQKALPLTIDKGGSYMCGFEEHHYIEMVQKDGTSLKLRLCFHCGEIKINDESNRIMPAGWKESLTAFITSLGLHPDGPWDEYPSAPK